MKRILCIGRVRNGGAVEITAPTLEERMDAQIARNAAQIERNAEILAMYADLDALQAGKPAAYRLTPAQVAALDDENPGEDFSTRPWQW